LASAVSRPVPLPLINRTRLPDADFRDLQLTVADHATLERVLGWGRTHVPPRRVEEIITQDVESVPIAAAAPHAPQGMLFMLRVSFEILPLAGRIPQFSSVVH